MLVSSNDLSVDDERRREVSKRPQSIDIPSLLQLAPVVVLAVGLVAYGVLYLTYDHIYSGIGVSPSEIGLDYLGLLSRAPGALVWIAPAVLLGLGLVWSSIAASENGPQETTPTSVGAEQNTNDPAPPTGTPVGLRAKIGYTALAALSLIIVGLVIYFIVLPVIQLSLSFSRRFNDEVNVFTSNIEFTSQQLKAGLRIEPIRFYGVSVLDIRATPSRVLWIGEAPSTNDPALKDIIEGVRCVSYLGSSDGKSVLFDPYLQSVLRIPESEGLIVRTSAPDDSECTRWIL